MNTRQGIGCSRLGYYLLLALGVIACSASSQSIEYPTYPTPATVGNEPLSLLEHAQAWLGTPYRSASSIRGPSGGVDCSHLVHAIFTEAGREYPYTDTSHFPPPGYFRQLSPNETRLPGDIVLFPGHLALWVGEPGREVLSAQGSPGHPGKVTYGLSRWFGPIKGVYRWAR